MNGNDHFNEDDDWMYDDDWDPDFDEDLDSGRCSICGKTLLDDMEIGQGYCVTAPCWMYATGQIELAKQWERENGNENDT